MVRVGVLVGVFAFVCGAIAQPIGAVTSSVEALAAPADTIFVGSLSKVEELERKMILYPRYRLTIQVDETLRGKVPATYTLEGDVPNDRGHWPRWKAEGARFIFFLAEGKLLSMKGGWEALKLAPEKESEGASTKVTPALPVMSMNLKKLTTPAEAIDALKVFLKTNPKPTTETHVIGVSGTFMEWAANHSGSMNGITVPITPELEKTGIQMVQNPASYLPKGVDYYWGGKDAESDIVLRQVELDWIRRSGVAALGRFKSAANIALLKPLLSDPTLWGFIKWKKDGDREYLRHYPIRIAAFEVLKSWGVKVATPVFVVP